MKKKINKIIELTKKVFEIASKKTLNERGWTRIGKIENWSIDVYEPRNKGLCFLEVGELVTISTLKDAESIEFNYLKADNDLEKTIEVLEEFINLNK